MKRPTMVDTARRAGVTKSAVTFAPNGRPGVSEAIRVRALPDGRAGAFGPVVDRPARSPGIEPFSENSQLGHEPLPKYGNS